MDVDRPIADCRSNGRCSPCFVGWQLTTNDRSVSPRDETERALERADTTVRDYLATLDQRLVSRATADLDLLQAAVLDAAHAVTAG